VLLHTFEGVDGRKASTPLHSMLPLITVSDIFVFQGGDREWRVKGLGFGPFCLLKKKKSNISFGKL
jgi:hypothetical protein